MSRTVAGAADRALSSQEAARRRAQYGGPAAALVAAFIVTSWAGAELVARWERLTRRDA